MGYHLDLSEQIRLGMVDPDDPTDQATEWGGEVGAADGFAGGVSEEGGAALGVPEARGAYLEAYAEGGLRRREHSAWRYGHVPQSLEGAGEMFMARNDPYYGWTDVYRARS